MFKKMAASAAAFPALALNPAMAQDKEEGSIQIKLLATAVLPDAAITEVQLDTIGLPAGSQT